MNTQPLGPFMGINNRLPDFALHIKDKGDYVRSADNVVVDNSGNFRMRAPDTLIQAMTAPHSWYETGSTSGYLVRAGTMYSVTLASGYSETLFKVLSNNNPMSWLAVGSDLYWSNGTDSGRISAGVNYPWGLSTPSAPGVSSTTGSLPAGWYQVAVSYSNSVTGEEGGVSPSTNFQRTTSGGLVVSLPGALTGATHVNVYVSTVNGSIPMLHSTYSANTATATISAEVVGNREAQQRYEEPLPAGTGLFYANGRLCSIVGSRVYYSLPWRHGYHLPTEGYIDFTATVSLGVANQAGVFICADKTYWFSGTDLGAPDQVVDVLPYGAVPGTAFWSPNKTIVGWFGAQGVVLSTPNGEVQAVMSDNIKLTPPASGCSTVLLNDDVRKVVSCGWCLNLNNLAATTYSGFAYTSMSGTHGTKVDGLYKIEDTQSAAAITWSIGFGKQNFGAENEKYLPAAYGGYASDVAPTLVVILPNGDSYEYDARDSVSDFQIHRFDVGRGLRANWFDLSVYSTSTTAQFASLSFAPRASQRRI